MKPKKTPRKTAKKVTAKSKKAVTKKAKPTKKAAIKKPVRTQAPKKGRVVNLGGLSDVFGVHLNTVRAWVKRGCPYEKRANSKGDEWEFNTAEVNQWKVQEAIDDAVGRASECSIAELQRRKIAAETEIMELKLQRERKEVVELADVERAIQNIFIIIKNRIMTIPKRYPSVKKDLQRDCNDILNEAADAISEFSAEDIEAT